MPIPSIDCTGHNRSFIILECSTRPYLIKAESSSGDPMVSGRFAGHIALV